MQKYVDRNVARQKLYMGRAEEKAKLHNPRTGKDKDGVTDAGAMAGAAAKRGGEKSSGKSVSETHDVVETVYEITPESDARCYTGPSCTGSFGNENDDTPPPPPAAAAAASGGDEVAAPPSSGCMLS